MNKKEIISAYRKLDTSLVSDALDSFGIKDQVIGLQLRSANSKLVGFAYTVKYVPYEEPVSEFQNAGNYIDNVQEDEVIVIDNNNFNWCTTWGSILTKIAENRKINGAVVHGAIRDIDEIQYSHLPVFSQHVFMSSGKNRVRKIDEQCPIFLNKVKVSPGDLVVGDRNGIVFVPNTLVTECLKRAILIEQTEAKILHAVLEEKMPLQQARNIYRYDQPWLEK